MTGYTKVITYFATGLILSAALYLFMIQPFAKKVAELAEAEDKAQTELQVLEQQIVAYNAARSDLSKAQNKDLLYSFFIDDKSLRKPIEEMENAAKQTSSPYQLKILKDSIVPTAAETKRGAAARAVEADKVTKQTTLVEVPYTLSIQNTSYVQILYFFNYLENIPHFTEISSIDISYGEQGDSATKVINAVIDGVMLVKPNES